MRLQFGQYSFPVSQVEVIPRLQTVRAQDGTPLENVWNVQVRGEFVVPSGTSNVTAWLNTQSAAMRLALQNPASDLVFYDNNNVRTDTNLLYAGSCTGLQTQAIQFPDDAPGAWATHRGFEFTVTAAYPIGLTPNPLVSYEETVTVQGSAGPNVIFQPALNTASVPVITQAATTARAIVRGSAVGYRGYPSIPAPLFVGADIYEISNARSIVYGAPEQRGRLFTNYPVNWTYVFESNGSLVALPRVWGGRSQ